MPRFSEQEKAVIRETLLRKGESLFAQKGVQKVTVEELCDAAGIAKGSFYAFFDNKEMLFMDIINAQHASVDQILGEFIAKNFSLPPEELLYQIFVQTMTFSMDRPIMQSMNPQTIEYLYRKIDPKCIEEHLHNDTNRVEEIEQLGIRFRYDNETVASVLQQMAITIFSINEPNEERKKIMIDILLKGVINQIVRTKDDSGK
jgi:AcrR family transcriptional regulator